MQTDVLIATIIGGRVMTRWIAPSLVGLTVILTGCSSEPPVPTQAAAETVSDAEPPADEPSEASSADLLASYGELLVSAASTGGDALERTLRLTADDRDRFDAECAPTWAHALLDGIGSGEDLAISTAGRTLSIGHISVPTLLEANRVVHRTDTPCDGRLPQPTRSRPAPAAAPSAPEPPASQPAPAPSTSPAPRVTTEPRPPAPAPSASPTEDPEMPVREYDLHLVDWSEIYFHLFAIIVEVQHYYGEVGGGADAAEVYATAAEIIGGSRYGWGTLDHPPAARTSVHADLLAGLELWEEETFLLRVCALSPRRAECAEVSELRSAWQDRFRKVFEATGIPMPRGDVSMPKNGAGSGGPGPGQWNIGDVRLPTEYEVRR
jgi:hypothetical protein